MELFSEPTFWIGLGTGAVSMALVFFGFVVSLGIADEADEKARREPYPAAPVAAGASLSAATQGRHDRSAARQWGRQP